MKPFLRQFFVALCLASMLASVAPPRAQATVNSTANKTIVLGNGVQTQFTFSFIGVAAAYISVILTDSGGNETVLAQGSGTTQYQIVLNTPVTGAIWGIGGTVTYSPSGTPIPAGSTLTIFRTLPLTQAISLQRMNSLATLGNGSETGLDTGVMQLQQTAETISRAIVAPIVDATPPAPLPPIAQRANRGAAFDGAGNLVAGATPSSGIISSAMQPVVNAATLALGRTAFGLGNMAVENIGAGLQDDGAGNVRVNSALTSVATNQSVDATFAEKSYVATGPINFTMARSNTLWNGFSFTVYALTGAITLVPDSNDSVLGQATGASVAIPPNSVAVITSDGAAGGNWRVAWSPWNVDGATKSLLPSPVVGSYENLVIQNNAGTPNTKIDATIGSVVMVNGANGGIHASSVSFTIDLTTGTVTSTPNGLDGEALPTTGEIFLFAISNGVTTAGLASTTSTGPVMPAGYSFKKYIGAMKVVSSALRRTRQINRRTQYVVAAGSNTATVPLLNSGFGGTYSATSPVLAAIPIGGFVPATASAIIVLASNHIGTASGGVLVAPNASYGGTNNGPTGSNVMLWPIDLTPNSASTAAYQSAIATLLLESTNIYWTSGGGGGAISCLGWEDAKL